MQHDDLPIDNRTVEDARDSVSGFQSKLQQPLPHGARMRHAKVGTIKLHSFRILQKSRNEAGRKRQYLGFEPFTEEPDFPCPDEA